MGTAGLKSWGGHLRRPVCARGDGRITGFVEHAAKLTGVDPSTWLTGVRSRIVGSKTNCLDQLLKIFEYQASVSESPFVS